MTPEHDKLAAQRDRALDDLLELDRQEAAGELTERDAGQLRARYQAEALTAIRALEATSDEPGTEATPERAGRRRLQPRHVLYALGLAAAIGVAVLVPRYGLDRPTGGLVSGNEAFQQPTPSTPSAQPPAGQKRAPSMDLSKVTDAQLEAVVAANPGIVDMRLALAQRYVSEGKYDLAVVHYTKALEQEPSNPEALAHLGWLKLQLGQPEEAERMIDQAVASDPTLVDARWFQANTRLYGLDDPAGALEVLDQMSTRGGLTPKVRRQVEQLRAQAQTRLEDGR